MTTTPSRIGRYRRALALSEARGYEPETSQARFLFTVMMWCSEPFENSVEEARRAKEGLISGGDLDNAGYTFCTTVAALLECAPSLDACAADLEAGLAFVRRIGSGNMVELLEPYQWVIDALRGEGPVATRELVAGYGSTPLFLLLTHSIRAMAAAILGDQAALERHTAEAMNSLSAAPGEYPSAMARVLRGLALARRVRATDGTERDTELIELDEVTRWLAARTADAPQNFLHLLCLVEAERAWACGRTRAVCVRPGAGRPRRSSRSRPVRRPQCLRPLKPSYRVAVHPEAFACNPF